MSTRPELSEAELHAYIDGALDGERRQEVEAIITDDPVLAARVDGYRSDMVMLKQLYGPMIDRPVPQEWIARARESHTRPSRSWQKYAAAAAAVLLVIGVTLTIQLRTRGPVDVVDAALQARNSASSPDKVFAAAPGGSTAPYDAALRSALGANIKIPDMTRMGFRFAALRVYAGGAAEVVYRDDANKLFTLYISHSGGTVRFDQFKRDGIRVCVWQDEVVSMVMSGDVSTAAMQRLASLAYTGLTL